MLQLWPRDIIVMCSEGHLTISECIDIHLLNLASKLCGSYFSLLEFY